MRRPRAPLTRPSPRPEVAASRRVGDLAQWVECSDTRSGINTCKSAISAPVAQWIEQRFPKPRAQVRFLPGALSRRAAWCDGFRLAKPLAALMLCAADLIVDRLRPLKTAVDGAHWRAPGARFASGPHHPSHLARREGVGCRFVEHLTSRHSRRSPREPQPPRTPPPCRRSRRAPAWLRARRPRTVRP